MFCEQDFNSAAFTYYRRLGRVRQFVDQHVADQITLEKTANIARLEKRHFSTYFHSKTGVRLID